MREQKYLCSPEQFQNLLGLIKQDGYKLLGPTIKNEVIRYEEIGSVRDLPIGWIDEQDPGKYRLKKGPQNSYFAYVVGPDSWRKFLFPPKERLFSVRKQENGIVLFQEDDPPIEKMAFIGARSCDIHGILVQDRVFMGKGEVYKQYQQRRQKIFILAVNCTRAANTCFCVTMKTGPEVTEGYDLALTEVINEQEHYFVMTVGSQRGKKYCEALQLTFAKENQHEKAHALVQKNREEMGSRFDHESVHPMLLKSWDKKRWDHVAERCVNCANCTLVCPTCFCSDSEDEVSLDGTHVNRWQTWDSCFNLSHSYVHGGPVHQSGKSRYRQWLTHKFGSWWDQFGISGCVGCGRCITWCPVGIDVTEELQALEQESEK